MRRGRSTKTLFSSHQITEVERVADHVCIIARGRLVLDAPLTDISTDRRGGLRKVFLDVVADRP